MKTRCIAYLAFAGWGLTMAARAAAGFAAATPTDIDWLPQSPDRLVTETRGFEHITATAEAWQGVVGDPGDPGITLLFDPIDADRMKVLYLRMTVESCRQMQVFFAGPGGGFSEPSSVRVRRLVATPNVYAIDLGGAAAWRGRIASLRLDPEGAARGSRLILQAVGFSERLTRGKDVRRLAVERPGAGNPVEHRHSAAWHDTVVSTLACNGVSGILTFMKERFTYTAMHVPAKFLVHVEQDGEPIDVSEARNIVAEDMPGGVRARFRLGDTMVTTEILPLMIGRDTPGQDGAAIFAVSADPPAPLLVDAGEITDEDPFTGRVPFADPTMDAVADAVTVEDGIAVVRGPAHALVSAVDLADAGSVRKNEKGGQYVRFRFPAGRGSFLWAYGPDADRAKAIARVDRDKARRDVEACYAKLLECRVATPDRRINDAFRTALCTLEYNWFAPFGWNESINHWHSLWHMQHIAAAEWIGQADRSRACILAHGENLMPDGAVPHMTQYLHTRRDFGGTNQFYAWEVRHHWQHTADREFAQRLAPILDRVIRQSCTESDPDHNRLLGWGLQIGNQEDYIATPNDGTTPSIEGLNMYRTRRELALGLGDTATVERCDGIIREIVARLRERLWQADLGRYIFYRDSLGVPRLDGQYHSLLYPVIWGVVDPPDGWSCLRHLRDRLQGGGGEVYCSNNFPNHVTATVGTQAGAAQQPWAAWGFNTAGMRNETWKPLAAVARWVMDDNHRGSWMEIAAEPNRAYFSPPAGLFIAATVEALFGLKVNRPEGVLAVSPSFPDDWTEASLNLPDYQADYRRNANTVEYAVRSREPLSRSVRWSLPPARLREVRVDDQPAEYRVEPGVGCVFLTLKTAPGRASRLSITFEPLPHEVRYPASVAEGERLEVECDGMAVERIEDRAGILDDVSFGAAGRIRGTVKTGLLPPYHAYGRLGQLNFSRRTFFLKGTAADGPSFWTPIDLTILPRFEATQTGELTVDGDSVVAKLLIRNNTSADLRGRAWLNVAQAETPFDVAVPAREQAEAEVRLPADRAALLSPGDNAATLVLPDRIAIDLTLDAASLFRAQTPLRKYAQARLQPVPLPDADLIADADWPRLRPFHAYPHMPWAGSRPPLEALGDRGEIGVPGLDDLTFRFTPRRFLPISYTIGRPSWSLPLANRPYKKLYLLVIPFLDNHDMFAPVAQVSAEAENGGVFARTLYFPGDLDWWSPPEVVGDFATARKPRPDRFGLLPLRRPDQGDWAEGKPPAFPQPEYWASCRTVRLASSVMNVVEFDLRTLTPLKSLTLSTVGVQPGLGLVAIVGETAGGLEALNGTPWMPPADSREPRTLFAFAQPADLQGWRVEGRAFRVATVPGLFGFPTLNSLSAGGEPATGRAVSPDFFPGEGERRLDVEIQGGNSTATGGKCNLCLRLVDVESGRILGEIIPPGTHMPVTKVLPLDGLQGRRLRLELIDENTGSSYAWIGIRSVRIAAN